MFAISALDGRTDEAKRPAEVRPFQASICKPEDGAEEEDVSVKQQLLLTGRRAAIAQSNAKPEEIKLPQFQQVANHIYIQSVKKLYILL